MVHVKPRMFCRFTDQHGIQVTLLGFAQGVPFAREGRCCLLAFATRVPITI